MTQYFYAPSASQENSAPPEISSEWVANSSVTATVKLDASLVPYVHFLGDQNTAIGNQFWRVISAKDGTTIPQVADLEMYMEFQFNTLVDARNGDFRLCARADLSTTGTGYVLGLRDPDLKIISVVAGTRSDLLNVTASPVPAVGTLYSAKAKLTGTTLETKFWETGTTEPAYQAAPANSAISASGYVGLYTVFPRMADTRLYKFSVSTGGDPVLTEEPASGPTLTTTLVADANDTALPAATSVNVAVLTTAWQLIGTATIGVGTDGALSITDADLTLEAGQSITSGTEYVVDIYDPASGKQRSPRLTAA